MPSRTEPSAALPQLKSRALYEDVADRLREQIFAGALVPGAWIDEARLSAEYGTSRTPLREALKVLAAEGLVTMKVRRGAYVTEVSAEDIAQIYHLLALLESDAAETVATQAGAADRERLAALHARLEAQSRRRTEFFATNEEFHLALLQIAGNRWAQQTALDLRKVLKLARHQSLAKQGRMAESLQEHRALMQAIEACDGPAAARWMRAHFDSGRAAAEP